MGVWKMHVNHFRLAALSAGLLLIAAIAFAAPYLGAVNHDVKRDRIIAIAEDYTSLYWYCAPENIDYSAYSGAMCPDPTVGWKTGMKYCWGGEDTTAQYLEKIAAGWGAGNRWTWGGSSLTSTVLAMTAPVWHQIAGPHCGDTPGISPTLG